MPTTLDTSILGAPVEVGAISKELKKLWDSTGASKSRASLINFAVYSADASGMAGLTQSINEFTRNHACRALLILAQPEATESRVSAWVNAHCHLGRAGAKQVCCEQISFLLEGKACQFIPSIVFANLDSDLPLHFWWQGEFHDPIDEQLWAWVDRLIFDSQSWHDPRRQFALLQASIAAAQSRLTLCDLNWARSLRLRQALAQMFDHPDNAPILEQLEHVEIAHAPGFRSTALLLVGWFAAQLRLTPQSRDGALLFTTGDGREVRFDLVEAAGRSIGRCHLRAGAAGVKVERDAEGDFFHVEVRLADGRLYRHVLPAGSNHTISLLTDEIGHGSRHRVYLKALAATRALF